MMGLRLNERHLIQEVVEATPASSSAYYFLSTQSFVENKPANVYTM